MHKYKIHINIKMKLYSVIFSVVFIFSFTFSCDQIMRQNQKISTNMWIQLHCIVGYGYWHAVCRYPVG